MTKDFKPTHLHWRKICSFCKTQISWCRCAGISSDSGSLKTLHGICSKCATTKSDKELAAFGYFRKGLDEIGIDPNAPLKVKEYVCKIGNVLVYLVDEDEIHHKWTTDWTEGGNWLAYPFMPKNEIWIDINMDDEKIRHAVFHEFVESAVWPQFGNYDDAHAVAVKLDDFLFGNLGGHDGESAITGI